MQQSIGRIDDSGTYFPGFRVFQFRHQHVEVPGRQKARPSVFLVEIQREAQLVQQVQFVGPAFLFIDVYGYRLDVEQQTRAQRQAEPVRIHTTAHGCIARNLRLIQRAPGE